MMEPISRSDLAAQQMTSNFYEIPFLNLKIKNQIGGAKIYAAESPQMTKKLKTEDTPASRDAEFDAAFRCAMNEV
jgi:hypothetical protein